MKKLLADNIMNLEDYLLTLSARHKYSELLALPVNELLAMQDHYITQLKNII